jgi:hypothetical protein
VSRGQRTRLTRDVLAVAYVIAIHFLTLLMRIRILSQSDQTNLPQFRSWFNVDKETTVASLKLSLCVSVPALRDAHIHSPDLILLLDDFELLDNSTVHILRDGDLVWYVVRVCFLLSE